MRATHKENHLIDRVGLLRAAVLGVNDGLVSTASLIVGVAASSAASGEILVAGTAGLVAGAMSMAAGEYVSVVPSPTPSRPTSRGRSASSTRTLVRSARNSRGSTWPAGSTTPSP